MTFLFSFSLFLVVVNKLNWTEPIYMYIYRRQTTDDTILGKLDLTTIKKNINTATIAAAAVPLNRCVWVCDVKPICAHSIPVTTIERMKRKKASKQQRIKIELTRCRIWWVLTLAHTHRVQFAFDCKCVSLAVSLNFFLSLSHSLPALAYTSNAYTMDSFTRTSKTVATTMLSLTFERQMFANHTVKNWSHKRRRRRRRRQEKRITKCQNLIWNQRFFSAENFFRS